MGRRALPRIDAGMDLSRHLLPADELPERCDAVSLFGVSRPLEIEVGSGKGLFLSQAARAQPLHLFVGIEVLHQYARFAAARLARLEVGNAKMIHADAVRCFSRHLSDNVLEAVHIYFPDPWWKKRHRRRRLMSPPFVSDVYRTLTPGGRLLFWTDVEEYFDSTMAMISQQPKFAGPFAVDEQPALHDMDFRTHFERRVRRNNLPVFRAEFRKPHWTTESTTEIF